MPQNDEYEKLLAAMSAAEPELPVDEQDEEEGIPLWSITYKTYRA